MENISVSQKYSSEIASTNTLNKIKNKWKSDGEIWNTPHDASYN